MRNTVPKCRFCKIRGHGIETCPKLQKRQEQKEKEDLKENRIEINNPTEKEKVFSKIPLIDFIVPTRKRSKKQNSQMTTNTPKRKKEIILQEPSASTKLIQKKKKLIQNKTQKYHPIQSKLIETKKNHHHQ